MTTTTPYEGMVEIATEYFGPAAQRVIDRLIVGHLHKAPQQLRTRDLPELIKWIKITISLLTDDVEIIRDCSRRLEALR